VNISHACLGKIKIHKNFVNNSVNKKVFRESTFVIYCLRKQYYAQEITMSVVREGVLNKLHGEAEARLIVHSLYSGDE
jgi:hypothetical protein